MMGAAAAPILIGSTILGTGASLYGTIQAGQAAKAQSQYQATVAKNNQIIADFKARDALERGKRSETLRRLQGEQLKSRQRATAAARGVEVDVGSALDITADTAATSEFDALLIRSNAAREALGFQNQAENFRAERRLRLAQGRNAERASRIQAFGTLAGSVSNVAGRWYDIFPPEEDVG